MPTPKAVLIVTLILAGGGLCRTGRGDESVDYRQDIVPLLNNYCRDCHGPDLRESGLRIDDRQNLLQGGDHGRPAVVPGRPDQSYLLELIRGQNPDLQMPPEGPPLTDQEVDLVQRWIQQGARFPDDAALESPADRHWSFQPVSNPAVPPATDSDNPIDAFIARGLDRAGLTAAPLAEPRTLLRRVSFVLTGLPPAPARVQEILSDPADFHNRYAEFVDELLASPRYGERWAQHWLDVIRWAETVGFETNLERPRAWPYRDWVIASLNADKPYDRFLFEQIAGDTVGQDAALGFLVAGPANLPGQIGRDEEAMRQARQDELDEVIRTVSQSIFGLTLDCARCHSHKFDPLTQRDYYAMQAVFAGLQYGERRLRGSENDEWSAQLPQVRERLQTLRDELTELQQRHQLQPPLDTVHTDTFQPVTAVAVRMQIHATTNSTAASLYEFEVHADSAESQNVALASAGAVPSASSFALANQTRHFDNLIDGSVDPRQAFPWVAASGGAAWIRVDLPAPVRINRVTWTAGSSVPADYDIQVLNPAADEWQTVADSRRRLPRLDDTREVSGIVLTGLDQTAVTAVMDAIGQVRSTEQQLARLAAGPQVYAASFVDQPPPTYLLRRGDPMQRADIVAAAIPAILQQLVPTADSAQAQTQLTAGTTDSEAGRRLAFARHVINPNHPLTARVLVNRVWQYHFGTGLVETPSDFGKMGAKPSHPELLDWLATDFVRHGWSVKRLQRLIVTSDTFRRSSRPDPVALKIDADSRLLWRFPPRRLEAEAIRDAILAVSGRLNLQTGGPGFDLFNQRGGLSDYVPKETFAETGWRRMIYAHKIRMQAVDIFGTFDCPDAGQMTPRRTQSITPLQALSLLNSPFANRQAQFFADRIRQEVGVAEADQIDHAFRLALQRAPTAAERKPLLQLARQHGLEQVCRVLFNTSEFLSLL